MARSIRFLSKKRGDRRTGSPLVGGLGEVLFCSVLFLLGATSLTYLLASWFLPSAQMLFEPGFGFWLMLLVSGSFTLIGGGGVIYAVLQIGTSAERRSAIAKRAGHQIEMLGDMGGPAVGFPTVPRDTNITNSPGIRLAYRLPVVHGGVWVLFVATAFFLICSGVATIVVTVAWQEYWKRQPDWSLTAFAVPLLALAVWATWYFVQQMLRHTGIGPSTVEISRHPLFPGATCELFVSQAGRLRLNQLVVYLVCQEETTYRQGTDIRTDHCRVHCQEVYSRREFTIEPGKPFEHLDSVAVPRHAMHSFQSSHNAVSWMLVVQVDAETWPTFERRFPIIVCPAAMPGGAS